MRRQKMKRAIALFSLTVFCGLSLPQLVADGLPTRRRPVAIVELNEHHQLLTANHGSGSISVVDLESQSVLHEAKIGRRLSDIVLTKDARLALVTDEENHELIAVRVTPKELTVDRRLKVRAYPVTVVVDDQARFAYIASLWTKTISVIDLIAWSKDSSSTADAITRQIELPFSPLKLLLVTDSDLAKRSPESKAMTTKLIVADAFGSKLAVVDPHSGEVESIRELPAHAIRQLRLHPSKPRLLLTHQMLSRLNHTTFDDIHWGGLMANGLRSLALDDVLTPNADLLEHSVLEYIGGPEQGAGDPSGFVMTSKGTVAVAISGTNQFIVDDGNYRFSNRVRTGQLPTAVTLSADESKAYVTNTLDDSITVVSLTNVSQTVTISLGETPELTAIDRGERLFHDASLSHDLWLSCASCHVDGHSNGLLNDNFTDESFGTAKRVLTLRGVADTAPYAWSGRFKTLREQITHSVQSTMQGEALSDQQISDLEAYITTLTPPPPLGSNDRLSVDRGMALFQQLACTNCHTSPTFTSAKLVDVNLHDEQGVKEFNPPSLRGVSQNAPYFHDSRAKTLEDVFRQQKHPIDHKLTDEQLRDLVNYLNSI